MWGGVIVGVVCFKQEDRKVLIAFSSINHIALVIFRILILSSISMVGGIILIVGHGFISSLLFYLNSGPYGSRSSRGLVMIGQRRGGGIITFLWLGGVFINSGFPPFFNFFGEVLIISNLFFSVD